MNTKAKVLGGILLGAGLGIVTGILVAPRSGKKTRKMILKRSKDWSDDMKDKANAQINGVKETYNHKLSQITKKGHSLVNDMANAVHAS